MVLLFGPTASGKTDLVAELFSGQFEVINADSEQVYRGLDIGTAKPPAEVRRLVPHHLIDILDPADQFTVGEFVREANRLAGEIRERGRVPLVSGGTAYYIKHFACGLPASPPSDDAIRRAVAGERAAKGDAALFAELASLDPETARKIAPNDMYRVTRALEVIRQTGRPLSAFRLPDRPRVDYDFLFLGLELSADERKERIHRRVDEMFASGLLDEIRALLEAGYGPADPGLRGIGYREFWSLLKGCCALSELKSLIALHTLQYAKRQMTFFKSLPGVRWFHPSEKEAIGQCVCRFLDARRDSS